MDCGGGLPGSGCRMGLVDMDISDCEVSGLIKLLHSSVLMRIASTIAKVLNMVPLDIMNAR